MARAFAWVTGARIALAVVPFRQIVRTLRLELIDGDADRAAVGVSSVEASTFAELLEVRRSLRTISRRGPTTGQCLAHALAGMMLLSRRPELRLYLGLRLDDAGALVAHSWLDYHETAVVGGPEKTKYVPLAAFQPRPSAR